MKLIVVLLSLTASAYANPTVPPLFGNHMVIQQGRAVPVWGWADPQERITVSILDHSRLTTADAGGRWRLALPALPAGGPYRLTVQGNRTVVIDDVLVGEVWICSGQSNMAFTLDRAATATQDIPDADYAGIRLFQLKQRSVLQPLEVTPDAAWRQLTPKSVRDFSAVGYLFARRLHKELGVPVGMIQTTWSGTTAELWTSNAALARSPELQPLLQVWDSASDQVHRLAAQPADFQLDVDGFELVRADGSSEPIHPEWTFNWDSVRNAHFEMVASGRPGHGLAARLSGGLEADESPALSGGFAPRHAERDLSPYVALRFYCRGHGTYRFDVLEPAVQDADEFNVPAIPATADWQPMTIRFAELKQAGWGVKQPLTPNALSGFRILPLRAVGPVQLPPASLFNGMVAPLARYGMRGVIWYQGEGNAGRAFQYRTLLPALIGSWRQVWNQGDFPFLIVQLPEFGARREQPSESAWAELREAQLLTLKTVPNTGLAVAMGLGEAGNVHPSRKVEVADRLALWALGTTYGRTGEFSGPLFDSAVAEAGLIRLHFQHTGTGLLLSSGSALRGFAIAGADRKFYWANARLDGDGIVASSPHVSSPVAVRYDWADNPDGNLANSAGLPASPFRSDDWPGVTTPGGVLK